MSSKALKIIFFITEDWFFLSHRLNLARACLSEGWRVTIATRVKDHKDRILSEGFSLEPIPLRRGSMNPIYEIYTLLNICRLFICQKPDIVHLVGLKMILYGSLISLMIPKTIVINAVSGLGTLFTSDPYKSSLIQRIIISILPKLLKRKNSWTIVQNSDDEAFFKSLSKPEKVILIPGSGVDIAQFYPLPEPDQKVTAAIVSRMLGEKGINEVARAARLLKERDINIRIRLIGSPDPENPSSIPELTLKAWHSEGIVEWMGYCNDVTKVWMNAHIALLPSYREGFPKSLIEAMASCRPAVTTNTIGCREVIEDGISGILVPPRDPVAIADALQKLVENQELRKSMGIAARKRTEELFSDRIIAAKTMALYQKSIDARSVA